MPVRSAFPAPARISWEATGAGQNTIINGIGGLELTGGVTLTEPLTINTPGDNQTMVGSNFAGVLRSTVSGNAGTYAGAITLNGAINDNTFRSIVIGGYRHPSSA